MGAGNAQNRLQGQSHEPNAYELWLGVPESEQPPNFYRLLDLPPLESDLAKIEQAAKRCVSLVEGHLDSGNDRAAKKLLKQIGHVRQTLLNVEDKARYDEKLRAKLSGDSDKMRSESAERFILNMSSDDFNKPRWLPEQLLATIAVAALGILAISVAVIVWQSAYENVAVSVTENSPPGTDPPKRPPNSQLGPRGSVEDDSSPGALEKLPVEPVVPNSTSVAQNDTLPTDVAHKPEPGETQPGDASLSESDDSLKGPIPGTPATISSMKYPSRFKNVGPKIELTPQDVLAERDLIIIENQLVLREELEIKTSMKAIEELGNDISKAQKAQKSIQGKIGGVDKTVARLTGQMMKLNARMTKLGPNNVLGNNKIVAEMNSISGKRDIELKDKMKLNADLEAARVKEGQARGTYIENILQMQRLAERIDEKYRQLVDDPEVQRSLAAFNRNLNDDQKFTFQRSTQLEQHLAQLKTMATAVLSAVIPIRQGRGNSLYVDVTLNGDKTIPMVLDSGASLVCLPHKVAIAAGVESKDSDAKILLQIANGETIKGTAVTIPTMRVGKFTVQNVDAVIIGPEAPSAPTLLGMSFLRNFQFKIDPAANELKLISINIESRKMIKNK
ncbi:hypothetical protein CA54_58430 [Symmachiella macrocystis]|uniref:J domain-containing protein n=1 Tax=Symmachiella macrocystis TaxID=2527985 RepID=A0A5C6AYM8_9PLAN|nr:retropepsin-like aspartic protease [Symmachiella macrocystis]TWU05155.1 hypothetical protein CA54_58430 [Symmachiella macrocystis]